MKKVHIHPGHWINKELGQNGGASGYINEVIEARKIANALKDKLGNHCIKYQDDTSTSQAQNLNKLVSEINKSGADFGISIHFNAGKGLGTETLVYSSKRYNTAHEINSCMIKALGTKDRGVKYRPELAVLRSTNIPVYLLEVCFVDSADYKKYKANFDKLVDALYHQLCKMLGITAVDDKIEKVETAKVNNTYKVKKGDTLYSIAKAHKVTIDKIKSLNGIKTDTISIGQKIRIK